MNRYFCAAIFIVLLIFNTGLAYAQTPGWAWMRQLQTETQSGFLCGSVVDPLGNIITACRVTSPCFMGYPTTQPYFGYSYRNYLWKQDHNGNTIWVKQIETESVFIYDVGADGVGNIYFTAHYYGTITLGGYTLTSPQYGGNLIAKLDAEGNYLWIKNIRVHSNFSVGADGSCFFTGFFSGTATFDDITLTCADYEDMFIARMNSEGVWIWARQATGWREVEGSYVAAGNYGECYVTGRAYCDVNFGEISLPEANNDFNQRYVAKYSSTGICLWAGSLSRPNYYDYDLEESGLVQDGLGNAYLLYEFHNDPLDYTSLRIRKFVNGGSSSDVFSTGTDGEQRGQSLAIDSTRNLYILGYHYEPFSFGNFQFDQQYGAVVIKLTANYTVSWAYDPSPGQYSDYRQICVTSSGLPYLTLATWDTYPVGGFQTYSGANALYVAGLNSDGPVAWLRSSWINHIGSEGIDIYQDNSGYNYACGNFDGSFLRGDSLYVNRGSSGNDVYVVRLTNGGTWLWTSCAGSSGNDEVAAIITDNDQNSYITGFFTGTMYFDDITITAGGDTDIFVAKLDSDGAWQWAATFGGSGADSGADIAVDTSGNIYVAGFYTGTVNFGAGVLASSGGKDMFVLKLDSSGNPVAITGGGGAEEDNASGIVLNPSGQISLCGNFSLTASFGNFQLSSVGDKDILVARLDADLNWLSIACAGGALTDSVTGIGTDSAGNCYITGFFNNSASFGNCNLMSLGDSDVFVAMHNPENGWQWAQTCGSTAEDKALAIAVTAGGTSYITGYACADLNYGTSTTQSYGNQNILCAAVSPAGAWLWAKLTGGWYGDYYQGVFKGSGVTANMGGNCSVTGTFSNSTGFATGLFDSYGVTNTFISTLIDGVGAEDAEQTPVPEMVLSANPNPFSEKTHVKLNLQKSAQVKLQIFNIRGEYVKTLINSKLSKGSHNVVWDGKNRQQRACSSGVYILKVWSEGSSKVIKIIKL
jgi:hypothetical protein